MPILMANIQMLNNRNFHSLLLGMQNGIALLEDSVAVVYKSKHILTVSAIILFGIYPMELKTMSAQKTAYTCL